MDSSMRADMEEFLQVCGRLAPYLTDDKREGLACIMYLVRQRTVLPYGEVDNLSASLAFAELFPRPRIPSTSAILLHSFSRLAPSILASVAVGELLVPMA
jgi:hypothetical protein